ncbi:hypothetical protein ONZ51_g628 [Trametes cubensis]|uniref:F-box domain-containing protein n=1 Tax=Trametes cubensis TaxID=1111947 RepID=A0AAD7U5E8_9APHY|nr:hypothetical protein ONZ51_g628 [Trametes cubensis]
MPYEEADILRADRLSHPYYGLPSVEDRPGHPETTRATGPETLRLRALHNSFVPVNQLPPELLIMVMSCVQYSPFYYQNHNERWCTILEVCRHWFVVGATAPWLWRTISPRTNIRYAWITLARSKQATIAVAVYKPHHLTSCVLLAGITPHAHRLRELFLVELSIRDKEPLSRIMEDLPMLEVLRVSLQLFRSGSALDREIIRGVQLTPGRFPRLRSLSARGVYLPNSTVWQQLDTLCLGGCPGMSLESLVAMVQGCIQIVQLEITNSKGSAVGPDDQSPVSQTSSSWTRQYVVPLPKLRKLHVRMEPRVIKHILSAILLPSTAQVAIEWVVDETSTEDELALGILAAMPDDLGCHMPILQSEDTKEGELRLFCQQRILSLRSTVHRHALRDGFNTSGCPDGTDSPSFSFDMYNADIRQWGAFDNALPMEDILTILHKAPLEALHVEISASEANLIDWRALLHPIHALRELTISFWPPGHAPSTFRRIFAALDAQDDQYRSMLEPEVLCPALRYTKMTGLGISRNLEFDEDLAYARECLDRRGRALGGPSLGLDEFVLVVGFYHSQKEFEEDRARALDILAPVVGNLVYERDRQDRDDPNVSQQDIQGYSPAPRRHARAKKVMDAIKRVLHVASKWVAGSLCR